MCCRCLNEFELASIPWKMNPENVCDMLRAICLEPKEKLPVEPSKPFERSVTGLRGRFIYDFLVPWIHTQVANRETSKSALILMVDNYRQGYLRLARALVAKGRLPQIDLIWHLTHTELGRLVQSPDPELIDKLVSNIIQLLFIFKFIYFYLFQCKLIMIEIIELRVSKKYIMGANCVIKNVFKFLHN